MTLARPLEAAEAEDAPLPGMIGECPAMREVYRLVRRVAPTDLAVLIEGETGTGKELVARAVHALSPRAKGPFVDINCAAIPEGLVESELFGCEPGAFTGATHRAGLLEAADGGTLFLDEACSLSPAVQVKLLRALERREFRRVGGKATVRSDLRTVVAVSRPLNELLTSGAFRADFAFRVATLPIALPSLRVRGHDIGLLAGWFLDLVGRTEGRSRRWHEDALNAMERYRWPGNVRELEMLVRRVCVVADDDVVSLGNTPFERVARYSTSRSPSSGAAGRSGIPRLLPTACEIAEALSAHRGVVTHAADALRLKRRDLYRLMRDKQIDPAGFRMSKSLLDDQV